MKEARHHRGPPGSLSLDTQVVRGRAGLGDHQIYFIDGRKGRRRSEEVPDYTTSWSDETLLWSLVSGSQA